MKVIKDNLLFIRQLKPIVIKCCYYFLMPHQWEHYCRVKNPPMSVTEHWLSSLKAVTVVLLISYNLSCILFIFSCRSGKMQSVYILRPGIRFMKNVCIFIILKQYLSFPWNMFFCFVCCILICISMRGYWGTEVSANPYGMKYTNF